jgi:hypothetical protein
MKLLRDRSPNFLMTVVFAALILLALASCSAQPRRPTMRMLAHPAPMPVYGGRTYQDVIQYTLRLQEWGLSCLAIDAANSSLLEPKE